MTDLSTKGSRPLTPHMSTFPIQVRINSGAITAIIIIVKKGHFWGTLRFITCDKYWYQRIYFGKYVITFFSLFGCRMDFDSSCMKTCHLCPQLTSPLHRELSEFRVQNRVSNCERALTESVTYGIVSMQTWADPSLLCGGPLGQARHSDRAERWFCLAFPSLLQEKLRWIMTHVLAVLIERIW